MCPQYSCQTLLYQTVKLHLQKIFFNNHLPVAHVKCEYIILSGSGFKSTNIFKMNSRAACASFCGPVRNLAYT